MDEKTSQPLGTRSRTTRRVRDWLRTLLAVLDDIVAVTLAGFSVTRSGLAAARASKARGRRL